jgi:serine/threonine protein kinase
VASLSHPNIVGVHDYGEDPSGPFIVMELVDGEDLATILRANGALPPRQAARIASAVAGACSSPSEGDRPPRREARERHSSAATARSR